MTDIVDPATRSRMMSGIRGRNTKPEIIVRKYLHAAGFRFRLHVKDLPGKPDIVLPRYKTVIFVHGCFWHQHPGCKDAVMPKSNKEFWFTKLNSNISRDQKNITALQTQGWKTIIFWECDIRNMDKLMLLTFEIRSANPDTQTKSGKHIVCSD